MWQKRSEGAGSQCVRAIKGALIFLLIPMLAAGLLPAMSLAKPALTQTRFQAIIPAAIDPTANLLSVADAQVRDWAGYQDTNYGTSTDMQVGRDLDLGTFRSFVRFDLASVPGGAIINSASFNAYVDWVVGSPTIGVYMVLTPWYEDTVTWNNQPSVKLLPLWEYEVTSDDEGKWVNWDVAEAVRAWLGATPNYGLSLRGPIGARATFYTRETAYAPSLKIDYTAEVPPVDTTPPQVSITRSPGSPTTEDQVTFTATGSDLGSGIQKIEILVNGSLVKTCTSSPCTYAGGPYPAGTVTYGANAYDKAGNRAWTGYRSFAVAEVELPDLLITDVKCDRETHMIGYKIRNIGKGVAPASHDTALIVELNDGEWEQMCRDHVGVDLEPGASYEGWFGCYSLPECKTMAVKVCGDRYNSVDESNEDNNCLEGECICGEELPNLEITDVWNTDSQICYRIRNVGEATADTPVNALSIDDQWVAEDRLTESLEPGEEAERCFDYHWQLTDGYDVVEVCADWREEMDEADEGNNCLSDVLAPPLPDLVVSIVGPGAATAGQDIDIEATIRNIGWAPAPGRINEDGTLNPDGYLVEIVLSSDRDIPVQYRGPATGLDDFAEDMLLHRLSQTVSILPGEEVTYTLSTHIPRNTPGETYCLGAVVDPGQAVDEYREFNNTYCEEIGICPTVEFNFSEGGRQVETSIPIFGQPDTDEDGVNDCWEIAAMEELEPLLALDEEEDWYLHYQAVHNVTIFVRIWRYMNTEDVTYIIFYYMVTWSKDYGRFKFWSAHAGDNEAVVTAWRVLSDNTMRMEWVYTSAHGKHCNTHRAVWSPWEQTCNVGDVCGAGESVARSEEFCAELQFSEATEFHPPRLVIWVSEDKHAMYPTCRVCEGVALVDIMDLICDYLVLDEIPVVGDLVYLALQAVTWVWDNIAANLLGSLWHLVSGMWGWLTGWNDDLLGKEMVMLTYDHLVDGVSPSLDFQGGDYHYALDWHIENRDFPRVRVVIDELRCVDETNPEWLVSDEPYLIITGFSTYPSIEVWRAGEPYFTGVDDNNSRQVDVVVFDGEVTPNSFIGFNVLLFEDDGSDTDAGDREQIGQRTCNEIRDGFVRGVAEEVRCEEDPRYMFTWNIGEDCGGGGLWLFPVYNIGEPGTVDGKTLEDLAAEGEGRGAANLTQEELDALLKTMWINDLTPYGFPREYMTGRDCGDRAGTKKFCGGLSSCDEESAGPLIDYIGKIPDKLKEKLGPEQNE